MKYKAIALLLVLSAQAPYAMGMRRKIQQFFSFSLCGNNDNVAKPVQGSHNVDEQTLIGTLLVPENENKKRLCFLPKKAFFKSEHFEKNLRDSRDLTALKAISWASSNIICYKPIQEAELLLLCKQSCVNLIVVRNPTNLLYYPAVQKFLRQHKVIIIVDPIADPASPIYQAIQNSDDYTEEAKLLLMDICSCALNSDISQRTNMATLYQAIIPDLGYWESEIIKLLQNDSRLSQPA